MGVTPITTICSNPTGATSRPRPSVAKLGAVAFGDDAAPAINPAVAYHSDAQPTPVADQLTDPITRKKYGLDTPFDDQLLRLNAWGKLKLGLEENFVALPKTIYHGLRGDARFTFSDFLTVTTIPYYLGGAFLALSFRMGRSNIGAARQAVGVGLYYLGAVAASKGIDTFYKLKTGVDLNLKFRKSNRDIERVFASTDFPRFDLLEERDHRRMMKRLGVPDDVSDPQREVQDQVRTIISASRADKLILGNILAAVGAGYVARSDAWVNLFKGWGNLKPIWNLGNKTEGSILQRVQSTAMEIGPKFAAPLKEAFVGESIKAGMPELEVEALKKARNLRYGLWGGAGTLIAMIGAHSWIASNRSTKRFESPFITNLSPALAPEQSIATAALQQQLPGGNVNKLPRQGVFAIAQRMESGQQDLQAPQTGWPASLPMRLPAPMPFIPFTPAPTNKGGVIVNQFAGQAQAGGHPA